MDQPHPPLSGAPAPLRGTRFLRRFFRPESLLLVGDSRDPALAQAVLDNLCEGGFDGRLAVHGFEARTMHRQVDILAAIGEARGIDLAITCVALPQAPSLLTQLGESGVKAVILLRDDTTLSEHPRDATAIYAELGEIAARWGIRVIGPDCLGIAVPDTHLNATFSDQPPLRGKLAYVGQSGMLGAVVTSWSHQHGIGLSHLISLGDSVDVRISDMLDFVSQRDNTQAIVLHVDRITDARHFVSALREAAKRCFVLAMGGTSTDSSAQSSLPPTPGIRNRSTIVDAALRRAGTLRIGAIDELYDSLEALTRIGKRYRGPRLMIVGNGSAPSLLASEALKRHGVMAEPSAATRQRLLDLGLLTPHRLASPLDLGGTARPQDFASALQILGNDPAIDAILVLHAPTRLATQQETAEAVMGMADKFDRPLLTVWMGAQETSAIRTRCLRGNVPSFSTPEHAVDAYLKLQDYDQVQRLLWATPSLTGFVTPRELRQRAQVLISHASQQGITRLPREEAGQVLTSYGIHLRQSEYIKTAAEGEELSRRSFGSQAVKALHSLQGQPFTPHDRFESKNAQFHCLVQDVATPQAMADAIERLSDDVADYYPDSQLEGFVVQSMPRVRSGTMICAGITQDAVFGPVIIFGRAGYESDVLRDRQVELPPLNMALAEQMVTRSEVHQLLDEQLGHNDVLMHGALERICRLLVTLSQMCAELPELTGLEINPLLVAQDELVAADYSVTVGKPVRQAIRPYPEGLREIHEDQQGGFTVLRPVRAEDISLIQVFYHQLSDASRQLRYFSEPNGQVSEEAMALMSTIDYDREMAFIIERHYPDHFNEMPFSQEMIEDGTGEMQGSVRLKIDSDNLRTEFWVVVRDEDQRQGLGQRLMEKAIAYARDTGIIEMYGWITRDNGAMEELLGALGFSFDENDNSEMTLATLRLNDAREDWQRLRLSSRP